MSSTFDLITGKKPTPTQQGNQWQQIAAQQQQFAPPVAQQQPAQAQPQAVAGNTPVQQAAQPVMQQQAQEELPYVSPTAHMSVSEKVKHFTGEDLNAPDSENNPYRDNQVKTYEDMTRRLEDEERRLRPETEEQKAKREKRERREKLFAAIGDGLSALSNVYFTTKGAPDMSSKLTLTDAVQGKYDKLKAEREADRDKYLNILKLKADNFGKLGDMNDAKHARRMALIKSAYEYERQQDENARKNRESDSKVKKSAADANKANAETDLIKVKTIELPKTEKSKRDLNVARTKQANAGAANSLAHAAKARVETAAARKKLDRENGKFTLNLGKKGVLKFSNEREFKKAVYKWAPVLGVDAAVIEGEERSYNGKVTKKGRVKYKPIDVVAGYVENKAETYNWSDYDNKMKQSNSYTDVSIR